MNLLKAFLQQTEFSSYEDFSEHCLVKVPEKFNFAYDVVDYYADQAPAQTALVWCDDEGHSQSFTFKEVYEQSIRAANFLKENNIKAGDLVMLSLHRRYEYWWFVLALHRLGAIALPLSSQLTQNDLEARLALCKASMIVAAPFKNSIDHIQKASQGKGIPLVAVNFESPDWISYDWQKYGPAPSFERPELSPDSTMLMYFTSGTEGQPKLVKHNFNYPLTHIITAKYWQKNIEGGLHYTIAETGWAKASWGKIYGQWIAGSAVFIYDRQGFNPQAILQKLADYKITSFCAPPVIYRYLVEGDFSKYDLSSLKHCTSAGEALNQKVAQLFYEKSGLWIYQGYGQTETGLLCGNFDFANQPPQVTSLGRANPLYRLSLINDEIAIDLREGHPLGLLTNLSEGNTCRDKAFYLTGDIAKQEADGFYYFLGRKDAIIKSAGFRISPNEVESIINRHNAVAECSVYGEEDSKRGRIVVAQIALKEGFEPGKNMEQEILDFVRQNTALYKCPRKIEFVKELPKTYNGKIKRPGEKIR